MATFAKDVNYILLKADNKGNVADITLSEFATYMPSDTHVYPKCEIKFKTKKYKR